jgi:hypothetical protein
MGTCYYLWREDNKTVYELGKSWNWGWAFGYERRPGRSDPMTLQPQDAPELAELLRTHLIEGERALRAEFGGTERDGDLETDTLAIEYFAFVCADIARWSEGQPFEFISENDGRYENASMEAWDRCGHAGRASIRTGSRYDAWRDRGPRCACADPTVTDGFSSVAYCTTCHRYKMCPICGEFAAAGEVACDKHRHRVGKGESNR